jgi:hypothetical protein
MDKNVYLGVDFIALNNEDGRIECKHVVSFNEYDDDITFDTDVPIEDIQRGWVGDMFCHLNGCNMINQRHKATYSKSIQNVLLSKITVSCEPNSVVRWRYTFLKD